MYNGRAKPAEIKETRYTNMNKNTEKALEQIAMEESYSIEARGGLDSRNSDSEDFTEISVDAIRRMLKRAYELGKAEATK